MMQALSLVFLTLSSLGAHAQITPLDEPIPLWDANIPPSSLGNECALYGNDALLVCTCANGVTVALDPETGDEEWRHTPTSQTNNPVSSESGVVFSFNPTIGNYIIHAVSEGFALSDPSHCVVYALDPATGEAIWSSEALDGRCSGTPVISSDGNYVFLTHNEVSTGRFTVLVANLNGLPFYQQFNPDQPYSPPGIFHTPLEGYYTGGSGNRNDMVAWSYRSKPNADSVLPGSTFAFQFPIQFQNDVDTVGAIRYLTNVTWQSDTAPVLYNRGYGMFFGVSRSEFRVWDGSFGDQANQFDKKASGSARNLGRDDDPTQAPRAKLILSSHEENPIAYGGTAAEMFAAFDTDLNVLWEITTTFPMYAEARVSPDDAIVYFVEQNGRVHSANATTGEIRWSASLGGIPQTADFGQSKSGKALYFSNEAGILQAWQVAQVPTAAPTLAPSLMPTINPVPTNPPTLDPFAPTVTPTLAPSMEGDTLAPTMAPSMEGDTLMPSVTDPATPPSDTPPTDGPPSETQPSSGGTASPAGGSPSGPSVTPAPTASTLAPTGSPTTSAPPTPGPTAAPPTSSAKSLCGFLVVCGTIIVSIVWM